MSIKREIYCPFFDIPLCRPEVTDERTDFIVNSDYSFLILTANFTRLSLFISEIMTEQCLKILLRYFKTGRKFAKVFQVTLDILDAYNMS